VRSRKFSCEKKAKIDFSNIKWWAPYSWGTHLSIYSPYSQPYVPFTLRKIFRVYFALLYMANIEYIQRVTEQRNNSRMHIAHELR
jgi:hypothetical protein